MQWIKASVCQRHSAVGRRLVDSFIRQVCGQRRGQVGEFTANYGAFGRHATVSQRVDTA